MERNLKPKVDSNNCVIVYPIKEKLYTKDEVEEQMRLSYIIGQADKSLDYVKRESWIKENLKQL